MAKVGWLPEWYSLSAFWRQHKARIPAQVVLDLGRRPEARFLDFRGGEYLRDTEVRMMFWLAASFRVILLS